MQMSNYNMTSNARANIPPLANSRPSKFKNRLRQYYWQSIAIISALAGTGVILQPHMASWGEEILAWLVCGCAWLIVGLIGVIIDIS